MGLCFLLRRRKRRKPRTKHVTSKTSIPTPMPTMAPTEKPAEDGSDELDRLLESSALVDSLVAEEFGGWFDAEALIERLVVSDVLGITLDALLGDVDVEEDD